MDINQYASSEVAWQDLVGKGNAAFLYIYRNTYSALFSYGLKISGDEDLTRDVIQDIFETIWLKRSQMPELTNVKSYLLTWLRRSIIEKKKKESKNSGVENGYEVDIELSHEDLLIDKLTKEIDHQKLIKAISSLSPRQREIIYLKFFDNLEYDAIAQITKLEYQSARNLLHKAIMALKKSMVSFLLLM